MKIKGKLISVNYLNALETEALAEIELLPVGIVEIEKLKAKDIILVSLEIISIGDRNVQATNNFGNIYFMPKQTIVAVASVPKTPKRVELPSNFHDETIYEVKGGTAVCMEKINKILDYLRQVV